MISIHPRQRLQELMKGLGDKTCIILSNSWFYSFPPWRGHSSTKFVWGAETTRQTEGTESRMFWAYVWTQHIIECFRVWWECLMIFKKKNRTTRTTRGQEGPATEAKNESTRRNRKCQRIKQSGAPNNLDIQCQAFAFFDISVITHFYACKWSTLCAFRHSDCNIHFLQSLLIVWFLPVLRKPSNVPPECECCSGGRHWAGPCLRRKCASWGHVVRTAASTYGSYGPFWTDCPNIEARLQFAPTHLFPRSRIENIPWK